MEKKPRPLPRSVQRVAAGISGELGHLAQAALDFWRDGDGRPEILVVVDQFDVVFGFICWQGLGRSRGCSVRVTISREPRRRRLEIRRAILSGAFRATARAG